MSWASISAWLSTLVASPPNGALPAPPTAEALSRAAVMVAIEELGRGETEGNNRGPDIRRYLAGLVGGDGKQMKEGASWCAAFAGYCWELGAQRNGVVVPFRRHAVAKRLVKNMAAAGRMLTDPALARPGDLIAWHRGAAGSWSGHIGIVERVKDGIVHTIEGNTGAEGKSRVRRLQHNVKTERLFGIASLRLLAPVA